MWTWKIAGWYLLPYEPDTAVDVTEEYSCTTFDDLPECLEKFHKTHGDEATVALITGHLTN